jgi:tetratricopeptide (TPR) repeat protein
MKKTLIYSVLYTTLFIGLALVLGILAVQPSLAQEQEMQIGNSLYENGRYAEAAQAYEQLIAQGVHDSAVYYNLGNAYFRQGDVGRAIFNYQRAAQLAPRDPDIQANLALARAQAVDQLPAASSSPLDNFASATRSALTLNEMALLALALWFFFGLVWLVYRQMENGRAKEMLQYVLILSGVAMVLGTFALGSRVYLENNRQQAVVIADVVDVSAGPSADTITEFDLHSGAEVELLEQRGDWVRLALPGGQVQGWVPAAAVAVYSVDSF